MVINNKKKGSAKKEQALKLIEASVQISVTSEGSASGPMPLILFEVRT